MRGKSGTAQLATVLQGMAQHTASFLDNDWLTLGTIRADGVLMLDTYRHPFELGEYLVLDTLDHEVDTLERVNGIDVTSPSVELTSGTSSSHTHTVPAHTHPLVPVPLPDIDERGRAVGEGDRVLVAWVNNGQANGTTTVNPRPVDVVVIGRVYWSK